ncbi:DUF7507 domain-containing protein [Actinophytocola sp.]|uniref:DUF7507 domain-containing protein n=1 Tax=Actinophytocola sp. TaxID=1872138 RepID=UPI002ED4F925
MRRVKGIASLVTAAGIVLAFVTPAAAMTDEVPPDTTPTASAASEPVTDTATESATESISDTTVDAEASADPATTESATDSSTDVEVAEPATAEGKPETEETPAEGQGAAGAEETLAAEPGALESQAAPVEVAREEAAAQAASDLSITQYAPEAAAAGAPITWTLTVHNDGPGAAHYTVTDPIPAGVTGVASPTAGCSVAGNNVTCTGGPLAEGADAVVTITGTTPNPFDFPLVNTATVATSQGGPDTDTSNNSSEWVTTTAAPDPQLGLVAQANVVDDNGNGVGDVGELIEYTVQVSNTGNVTLFDLVVEHDGEPIDCDRTVLSLDQSTTCDAPNHEITDADLTAGEVATTTTGSARAPSGATVTDESHTNVPIFEPRPQLALVKAGILDDTNDNDLADLGEEIDYTFTVTNIGNVPLTALSVVDAAVGGVTCPQTSMAPNAIVVCTSDAPHITTEDDIEDGEVVNSAFARATAPGGGPVVSPVSTENTPTVTDVPGIALDKRAELLDENGNDLGDLGERIRWTFLVVNNGSVRLTNVTINDPEAGGVTCQVTTLEVQQATTCVATTLHVVNEADILAGRVDNTAVARGLTDPGGAPVLSDPDSTVTPTVAPAPSIALDKRAELNDENENDLADAGETIDYSFVVTNTGNLTLTGVTVTDPKAGTVTCPTTTLAPGASTTCTAAPYTVTDADIDAGIVRNTAVASGQPPRGPRVESPPDTEEVPVADPSMTLDKRAQLNDENNNDLADAGETITYTFQVTNTGNVPLADITVNDPKAGTVTCPSTTLAPGASTTCVAAPYTVTDADIDAGIVRNVATASGQPPGTDPPIVTPPDREEVPVADPDITLDKRSVLNDENDNDLADAGETIAYTFLVTNTGNVPLTGVTVNDPKVGPVTCPTTTLAPGASTTCVAQPYTVTDADIDAGIVRNVATASGQPPGTDPPIVTPPDQEDVPVADPDITLDKRAQLNDENDNDLADAGETIAYSFVVTNTGNVTLTDIQVNDPKAGAVTCPSTTLAPGASTTCTAAPYTVTDADIDAGVVRNVATASGQPPGTDPPIVTPPDEEEVPIADPSITLDKRAQLNDMDNDGFGSLNETITYTFLVTNTGNVPLTDVKVDDPKVGPVTCPTTTLAPGASTTCTAPLYTVTQADVDAGEVHNIAIATGQPPGTDPPISSPPDEEIVETIASDNPPNVGEAPGIGLTKHAALHDQDGDGKADAGETITYTFHVTNTGDTVLEDITVDDPKVGLVTCPSTTLQVGAEMTCTAALYTVTNADIDAGRVHNVATASGLPPGQNEPVKSPPSSATVPVDDDQAGGGGASLAGDSLAYSGAGSLGLLLGWAMLFLAGGAVLFVVTRRPRDD